MSLGIQNIIFRKTPRYLNDPCWTKEETEGYLKEYELYPIDMKETNNFYKYRITNNLYKKIYPVDYNDGMLVIIGCL